MSRFDLSELKEHAHIHFIGIGGISMSGLAQIMLGAEYTVTGSDKSSGSMCEKLEKMGAKIYIGHDKKNIEGADLIVHTAAVHEDNPEMKAAKRLGIKNIDRAEFLGAVMKRYKHAVGVAGTHGKTTTTSMLAHALMFADADPTISVGGELDLIGGNVRVGKSDIFVTEACEYTNSFLKFYPTVALITNIEEDHLDFFSGLEEIKESFKKFAELTGTDGLVIACGDDENVRNTLKDSKLNILYYGMSEISDYYPRNIKYTNGCPEFEIYFRGEYLCKLKLKVPGEHNIKNAIASIAVVRALNIDIEAAAKGIETYVGVHRRFEKKGVYGGAVIMDDYAHHPTEIKTTLEAAGRLEKNRLICVFQPHTYSRTRTLWKEFTEAFDKADELILLDIYAAREVYDGETRSSDLAEEIKKRGVDAKYIESFEKACEYLKKDIKQGDIVFTMGAGDVYKVGDMLLSGK